MTSHPAANLAPEGDNRVIQTGSDRDRTPGAFAGLAARSKSSVRGFIFARLPAESRPCQIIHESQLERRVLLTFLARRDTRVLVPMSDMSKC